MMNRTFHAVALAAVGIVWSAAADDAAKIRLLDGRSCVFAERTASWRVELTDQSAYEGRLAWSLSAFGGVIARREEVVRMQPGEPVVVEIGAALPSVREGVVGEGRLALTLLDDRQRPRAEAAHPVYVFGPDPAAARAAWLRSLDLRVYDPAGTTAQKLDGLGWPFRRLSNLAALDSLGEATLIVGEGCSLRESRGLLDQAVRAARNGARVVFLAPTDGEFPPPESAESLPGPESLHVYDASFVRALDKRLDVPAPRGTFRLAGRRTGAEWVVEPAGGWACLELRWANGGALVLAGWGLLETWDASPAPRQLLFRMLESANKQSEREP